MGGWFISTQRIAIFVAVVAAPILLCEYAQWVYILCGVLFTVAAAFDVLALIDG